MNNLISIFFVLFFCFAPLFAFCQENNWSTFTSIKSYSYSDIAPIDQVIHNLEGNTIHDGDFAYTENKFEIGFLNDNWVFSYIHRYDYFLEFTPDTAHLLYQKNNNSAITQEQYDVFLYANFLESNGFTLKRKNKFSDNFSIDLALSYLNGIRTKDGYISGNAAATVDEYSASLYLDYIYSEDTILKRKPEKNSAHGFTVDFTVKWQPTPEWKVRLSGRDVISRIYWNDMTFTNANATTNTISYDEDGLLHSIPGISGYEGYKDHIQKLPSKYSLINSFQVKHWASVSTEIFAIDQYIFPIIGAEIHTKGLNYFSSYNIKSKAINVGFSSNKLSLTLGMDDTSWDKATAINIELSLNLSI